MANVIKLLVDERSESMLKRYLAHNTWSAVSPRDKLHSTIRYSKERPIFPRPHMLTTLRSALPITIKPPYEPDVFERKLILKYQCEAVDDLIADINQQSLRHRLIDWADEERLREEEIAALIASLQKEKWQLYPKAQHHITLADRFATYLTTNLPLFGEEITFDAYSWKVL